MSAPTPYTRNYNFTTFSTENPTTQQPGAYLDSEFNEIASVMGEMQTWNGQIQRSDGALANQSVGVDQLQDNIIAGINAPTDWASGTLYHVLDSVIISSAWYYCIVEHTSTSVFANDLAAGDWHFMFNVNTGTIDIQQQISNYAAQGVTAPFQRWTLTGSTSVTVFTITGASLLDSSNYLVSVGGVLQSPAAYTITTNTITFSSAPPNGVPIWITCIGYPKAATGLPIDGTLLTDGTVTLPKLAVQAAKTVVMNNTSGSASPTAVTMSALNTELPVFVGDSGSGGTKGLVPAPTAGQGAADAFLNAGGTFEVPPTSVGDSGLGGTAGYVPGAIAGDAVLQKFYHSNGTYSILPSMIGDSGAGGTRGVVSAPAPGDAALGKFWKSDGTWSIPPNTSLPGFRNRGINGDFRLNALKNAAATYAISTATPLQTLDKWNAVGVAATGVFTVTQGTATPPAGYLNFMRATVGTADAAPGAGSFYSMYQTLAGTQVSDFGFGAGTANTVTLSFQVRSTVIGTFSGAIANAAANRSYPFIFSILSANTWTTISVVIPGDATGTWPANSSDSLSIRFDLGSGTTKRGSAIGWQGSDFYGVTGAVNLIANVAATYDVTAVQLEKGTSATTFEFRPVEVDRLIGLAQVYCEYVNNSGQALTANTTDIIFITKVTDTHNAYNVSTGVFTAPKAGKYSFEGGVGLSGSGKNTLQLYKATVATYALAINGGTGYATCAGQRTLNLAQGDTVTIRSTEAVTVSASAVNNFLIITSIN